MTVPVKIFADHDALVAEEKAARKEGRIGTFGQFEEALSLPFVRKAALMPDAHLGYSLPIGAVVATQSVLVPSWVGYDIGCGVGAVPTTFNADLIEAQADKIYDKLLQTIPVGFNLHSKSREVGIPLNALTPMGQDVALHRQYNKQIGTLGGGNHFIEIGVDADRQVWIIVHSGSRGVGHGIATEYIRMANPERKVKEGHYGIHEDSINGPSYINDVDWCLRYAIENRRQMICSVVEVLQGFSLGLAKSTEMINRNHNHVEKAAGLWVHRKGATHAEANMMGVIPGNMRDGSFIVRGKGNPDSLCSSSHGAGRVLSRKKAKAQLDSEEFKQQMVGIACGADAKRLDEAPGAYKNIFEVMEQQKDLVEVVAHVKPLVNVKG